MYIKYKIYTRHHCATQALAPVHVALPHGPKHHVASTWARAINAPIFLFFLIILIK